MPHDRSCGQLTDPARSLIGSLGGTFLVEGFAQAYGRSDRATSPIPPARSTSMMTVL